MLLLCGCHCRSLAQHSHPLLLCVTLCCSCTLQTSIAALSLPCCCSLPTVVAPCPLLLLPAHCCCSLSQCCYLAPSFLLWVLQIGHQLQIGLSRLQLQIGHHKSPQHAEPCTYWQLCVVLSGAFCAGLPVQGVCLRYSWTHFDPSWCASGPSPALLAFRMMCQVSPGLAQSLSFYDPVVSASFLFSDSLFLSLSVSFSICFSFSLSICQPLYLGISPCCSQAQSFSEQPLFSASVYLSLWFSLSITSSFSLSNHCADYSLVCS